MEEVFKLYKDTRFHGNGAKWEISNFGRVKKNGEIYEPAFSKYYRIGNAFLHRIVYELLKGEIPEGYVVDHIDTNVRNNHIDNLRACTPTENNNNPLTVIKRIAKLKGRKMSDETKQKISELKLGNTNRLGKGFTEESKKQISDTLKKYFATYTVRRVYDENGKYHYEKIKKD